jgi:hypothetical protein
MKCAWGILREYQLEARQKVKDARGDPESLEEVLAMMMAIHGGKLGEYGLGVSIHCGTGQCQNLLTVEEFTGDIKCSSPCSKGLQSTSFTEFAKKAKQLE